MKQHDIDTEVPEINTHSLVLTNVAALHIYIGTEPLTYRYIGLQEPCCSRSIG